MATVRERIYTSILLVGAIIFALLTGEMLVRLLLPQDRMVTWLEMHDEGFMMNQQDLTALHQFQDRELWYELNEDGLRERRELPDSGRVLVLGDSFTFGLMLHGEDTFIHLLNERFSKTSPNPPVLLNAGVGGAGLADWPGWLEHQGAALQPEHVIYMLNIYDLERALSKNLWVYDSDSDELFHSQRWHPRPFFRSLGRSGFYQWIQRHSELTNILVSLAWKHLYFEDLTGNFDPERSEVLLPELSSIHPDSTYPAKLGLALLRDLQSWSHAHDAGFHILTTGYFDASHTDPYTRTLYDSLLSGTDLPFYDLTPCLRDHHPGDYEGLTIPGDDHPNETGAKLIAECSFSLLESLLSSEPMPADMR